LWKCLDKTLFVVKCFQNKQAPRFKKKKDAKKKKPGIDHAGFPLFFLRSFVGPQPCWLDFVLRRVGEVLFVFVNDRKKTLVFRYNDFRKKPGRSVSFLNVHKFFPWVRLVTI